MPGASTNPSIVKGPKRIWTPEELAWTERYGCQLQCPCIANVERLALEENAALRSIFPKYELYAAETLVDTAKKSRMRIDAFKSRRIAEHAWKGTVCQ